MFSTSLRLCLLIFFTGFVISLAAQEKPVQFSFSRELTSTGGVLKITAHVQPGLKLFSLKKNPAAPVNSTIAYDSAARRLIKDSVTETGNIRKETDKSFDNSTVYFVTDSLVWRQPVDLSSTDSAVIHGTISYFVKKGDEYNSYEEPFRSTFVKAKEPVVVTGSLNENLQNRSLLWIFIASFGGGLLALLTPCVYSMIPVTVSFFTKRSATRKQGIKNAFIYSASIVLIFTLLGFLITLVFGPAALNKLATNWIANLLFFLIFLVFGISFLGAFEITLPSAWTNKAGSKSGTGGVGGIFFMALTLALVSFSCTGPIIGNLIVLASKGSFVGPLIGMFGFSLALALPFALFALFPGWLNGLGKAGSWLNSIKVVLGFLEIALALKFLSNADLAKGWRLLDREIFLALWIVIFGLLSLYLLGKIRFHHDDELPKNDYGLPYLTIPRLFFVITSLSFMVYLVPGMWGAPLKGVSAFLPPYGTQDFIRSEGGEVAVPGTNAVSANAMVPTKYVSQMKQNEPEIVKKYGLVTYFDYDEALAAARVLKKPLMLDFTGVACVNCRKMESQVWSNPEVIRRLKNDFVVASLFTDVQNIEIPESENYFSKDLGETVNTLGEKFADLEVSRYGSLSQPFYIFLDGHEQKLAPDGYPYDPDVQKFIDHLDRVIAAYKKTAN